jgi:hypothetical protein
MKISIPTTKARTPKRRAKENISDLVSPHKRQTTYKNSPAHRRLSSTPSPLTSSTTTFKTKDLAFPPSPGEKKFGTDRTRFLAAVAITNAKKSWDCGDFIGGMIEIAKSPKPRSLNTAIQNELGSAFSKVNLGTKSNNCMDSDDSSTTGHTTGDSGSDSDVILDDRNVAAAAAKVGILKFGGPIQNEKVLNSINSIKCMKSASLSLDDTNIENREWTNFMDNMLKNVVEQYAYGDWKSIHLHCSKNKYIDINSSSSSSSSSSKNDNPNTSTKRCGLNPLFECSQNELKFRWNKICPSIKGPWRPEEDKQLSSYVCHYGVEKWSLIATHIPGRIGKQCRERWKNHLDPTLNKSGWSVSDDQTLLKLQSQIGNRWSEIAKSLNGRGENSVKNRYHSLMGRKSQSPRSNFRLLSASDSGSSSSSSSSSSSDNGRKRRPTSAAASSLLPTDNKPLRSMRRRHSFHDSSYRKYSGKNKKCSSSGDGDGDGGGNMLINDAQFAAGLQASLDDNGGRP